MGHLSFPVAEKEKRAERITFDLGPRDNGRQYALVEHPSIMPLLGLGSAGDLDLDALDKQEVAAAMGSVFDFFKSVLEPAEVELTLPGQAEPQRFFGWSQFRRSCTRLGLDGDDLLPIIRGLVSAIFALPTGPPSASPTSPTTVMPRSTGAWPSPAQAASAT